MEHPQITRKQFNAEDVVVLQERPKHVGLIPGSSLFDPILQVFKWVEDVMHMNMNACGQ
jgi:hypothetical protein